MEFLLNDLSLKKTIEYNQYIHKDGFLADQKLKNLLFDLLKAVN